MKQIKFNKRVTEDKLIVDVSLPRRIYASEPVINFSNSELLTYLEEQNINILEYEPVEEPNHYLTSYSNKGVQPLLEGTWTFQKKEQKVQKKVNKRKTQTYNKEEDKTGG